MDFLIEEIKKYVIIPNYILLSRLLMTSRSLLRGEQYWEEILKNHKPSRHDIYNISHILITKGDIQGSIELYLYSKTKIPFISHSFYLNFFRLFVQSDESLFYAFEIFQLLFDDLDKIPDNLYMSLLLAASAFHNEEIASQVISLMQKKNEYVSHKHYFLYLLSVKKGDLKSLDMFQELLESFKVPLSVGETWIKEYREDEIDILFLRLKTNFLEGYLVKVEMVNLLIYGFGYHLESKKAVSVFDSIQDFELQPNLVSFLYLFEVLTIVCDFEKIKSYYEKMVELEINPDYQIFSYVLEAYIQLKDFDNFIHTFQYLDKRKIKIERKSFHSILKKSAKNKRNDIVEMILRYGKKHNILLTSDKFKEIETLLNQ